MKKWLPVLGLAACLMMSSAAPASAYTTYNTPGNEIRNGVNEGINTTNRALGTDMNYVGTGNNVHTNNYRPYATTNNNKGFNWGWLGLLGLFGLAGMRSHNRDRDRA